MLSEKPTDNCVAVAKLPTYYIVRYTIKQFATFTPITSFPRSFYNDNKLKIDSVQF